MSIERLEPNKEYMIVSFKKVETKFGPSYIVSDSDFKDYFATKKVIDYIDQNNVKDKGGEIIFKIVTGPQKSFMRKNKDGSEEEIKYIDCRCLKVNNKK